MDSTLTRRTMLSAAAASAVVASSAAGPRAATVTAGELIDRMKQHVGGPWREGHGVDGFKAGSPDTVVTGVATTMMATFDCLKAARAQGCNMVITHEPTYWSHPDTLDGILDDPLYKTKRAYLEAHNMVSFHLHDHWHALKPIDGINVGTMQLMGWTRYEHAENPRMFTLPPITLLDLARDFGRKMNDRTLRVVGDPDLPVHIVYESWGHCSEFPGALFLNSAADVLVIGEAQDWDLVEFAQDLVSSGRKKGLILLGHVLSEQWGMKYCAEWLKGFVTEVPVKFVRIAEPYWNLYHPVFEINPRI
jgi:putative NIF3 family GTP cyclohydrolase 1 type 2